MIGVKGQYLLKFNIGELKDFLKEEDLSAFSVVEEAGNVLPAFELAIKIHDSSFLQYFNEGNVLQVAMGKDELSLMDVHLRIQRRTISRVGKSNYVIYMVGLYDAINYLSDTDVYITEKKSGAEILKDTANMYFKDTDFNIETSDDSQYWIRANQVAKLFINEVWMHSYVTESFIAIGIASDGTFILKDIRRLLSEGYKWKFTSSPKLDNEVAFEGDCVMDSETGFVNSWVGYEREKTLYNLDTGETTVAKPTYVSPLLALSDTLDRNFTIGNRSAEFEMINENVHENYWTAYLQNLTNLAVFGSNKIFLNYRQRYADMRILDLVMLKDDDLDSNQAEEYHSGLYIITKIKRTIQNKELVTMVEMNREALNALSGALR